MTQAFKRGIQLLLGAGNSPETFTLVCEILSLSGLGKTNELIDVSNFCSPDDTREYIAGIADGAEISMELNFIINHAMQAALRNAVNAGETRNFQLKVTDGTSELIFSFAGVCQSWTLNPSVDAQNTISFTVKITGEIEEDLTT